MEERGTRKGCVVYDSPSMVAGFDRGGNLSAVPVFEIRLVTLKLSRATIALESAGDLCHRIFPFSYCLFMSQSITIDHHPHSPRAIMSNVASPSTPRSNLDGIFKAALRIYKKNTGKDITSHPLAAELQLCDSPDTILAVLRRQLPTPDQSKKANERFEKCLIPTVNVLYNLSDTLGGVAGLVIITTSSILRICVQTSFLQIFPPVNIIFTGIGALLLVG